MALAGRLVRRLSKTSCLRVSLSSRELPTLSSVYEGQTRYSSDAPYVAESPPTGGESSAWLISM